MRDAIRGKMLNQSSVVAFIFAGIGLDGPPDFIVFKLLHPIIDSCVQLIKPARIAFATVCTRLTESSFRVARFK